MFQLFIEPHAVLMSSVIKNINNVTQANVWYLSSCQMYNVTAFLQLYKSLTCRYIKKGKHFLSFSNGINWYKLKKKSKSIHLYFCSRPYFLPGSLKRCVQIMLWNNNNETTCCASHQKRKAIFMPLVWKCEIMIMILISRFSHMNCRTTRAFPIKSANEGWLSPALVTKCIQKAPYTSISCNGLKDYQTYRKG